LAIGIGLLVALVVRISVAALLFSDLGDDPDAYRMLAENWSATGTFGQVDPTTGQARATAFRPPLYPWFLSWLTEPSEDRIILSSLSVAIVHVVVGLLTVLLSGLVCSTLLSRLLNESQAGPNELMQLVAGPTLVFGVMCLVAVDPILIRQSTLVMTETLAACLAILGWWSWIGAMSIDSVDGINVQSDARPHRHVMTGLWLAALVASIYCRPTALAWVGILVMGLVVLPIAPLGRRCLWAIGISVVIGAALLPWVSRNQRELGEPVLATTHGGYTLLLANNPDLYRHFETSLSRTWDEDSFHRRWNNVQQNLRVANRNSDESFEILEDRMAKSLAWKTINDHPALFIKSCVARVGWLWAVAPDARQGTRMLRWAIGAYYSAVLALFSVAVLSVIWRAIRQRVSSASWLLFLPATTLFISITGVHSVFWSNMRMRAVVMPMVYIVIGLWIFDRLRQKMNSRSTASPT
jgi:hypothetical protein